MDEKKLVIRPKRPKGDDGYKIFSVRVREETIEAIDDIAAKTGRSRNELIGMFLKYAIDHGTIEE